MKPFNWTCPYCGHLATITGESYSESLYIVSKPETVVDNLALESTIIICPNPECDEFTVSMRLYAMKYIGKTYTVDRVIDRWDLKPFCAVRKLPEYIPEQVRKDYQEANLTRKISPKASAIFSRRCIQGMIRDYLDIRGNTLAEEIEQTQSKIDANTWRALDTVRKMGNIGAHFALDIDRLVDVDLDEANILVRLIEVLINGWYINREEKKVLIEEIGVLSDVNLRAQTERE